MNARTRELEERIANAEEEIDSAPMTTVISMLCDFHSLDAIAVMERIQRYAQQVEDDDDSEPRIFMNGFHMMLLELLDGSQSSFFSSLDAILISLRAEQELLKIND